MLANLKAALRSRGITQLDLALALGMNPSMLTQIILCRRLADQVLRARIAEALGLPEDFLFARIEVPPFRMAIQPGHRVAIGTR